MKKVLINYSDSKFESHRKWNTRFAKWFGGFDKIIEFSPDDIDSKFYENNKRILQQNRGGGYFLWKPYFVKKALNELHFGDYLFYADSGSVIFRSIEYLIRELDHSEQDIMVFTLPLVEKQWTKRDAFILMDCDTSEFADTNQRLATYFLIKKSEKSEKFINDYLFYSQDERIITDNPNVMGFENYHEFIENRHDQSILSLLSKKYNLKSFKDPSHRGVYLEPYSNYLQLETPSNNYPILIISNRGRNIFLYVFWFFLYYRPKFYLKKYLKRWF